MRVFVTGVTGQLRYDVMNELVKRGHEVIGSGGRKGEDMKVFVTGVARQLGHDCVNELVKRGHEVVGSDVVHVAAPYSGANELTPIARMDYVQLNITDQAAVASTIEKT